MIKHESEGYYQGGWKSQSTRLNQIRFYNEVLQNKTGLTKDGLTTLKFNIIKKIIEQANIVIKNIFPLKTN